MYSFPEIGPSIPLKSYKARLHELHKQTMEEKNQQLNKEFLPKQCHGMFYVTLCLQTGGKYLKEDNITRKVESLGSSGEIELETIMDHQDRDKEDCIRVLLLGGPGTGKTTISQTLSYRWGIRELWDEKYDFVFHLTCRKLKADYKTETNILQLLIKHHPTQKNINIQEELYQHIKLYADWAKEAKNHGEVVEKHKQWIKKLKELIRQQEKLNKTQEKLVQEQQELSRIQKELAEKERNCMRNWKKKSGNRENWTRQRKKNTSCSKK